MSGTNWVSSLPYRCQQPVTMIARVALRVPPERGAATMATRDIRMSRDKAIALTSSLTYRLPTLLWDH